MALKHWVFWIVAVSVFILDRITKLAIMKSMALGDSISVLPFLAISYVQNTGTAFGLLKNGSTVFIVLASLVSAYILYVYRRYQGIVLVALALLLAGALGNLLDRLLYGSVIDFINFHIWPVFNIADSAITVAIVLLLFHETKALNR
ncbi:signal peptidase II [Candidatus Woesearchaeota archaeon]|nr:signal peptidase II [Candidatus Woesearchaeota archaeon]